MSPVGTAPFVTAAAGFGVLLNRLGLCCSTRTLDLSKRCKFDCSLCYVDDYPILCSSSVRPTVRIDVRPLRGDASKDLGYFNRLRQARRRSSMQLCRGNDEATHRRARGGGSSHEVFWARPLGSPRCAGHEYVNLNKCSTNRDFYR
jgi:hypothetical protein